MRTMQCPKCHAEQAQSNPICERCGIVFAKYYKYHPRPGEPPPALRPTGYARSEKAGLAALLLPEQVATDPILIGARGLLWLVLAIWGLRLMLSSVESGVVGESVLHLVNLPFHEAGHVFFRPFGPFITSLGGTLGQLLMPAICLGVLLVRTRDPFGAAVCLWWLGESFLDIAPYIADARARVLPLVGGGTGQSSPYGYHDWEYLLTESGLLHLDRALGGLSHLTGALLMLAALAWGLLLLRRQWRLRQGR